jgi:Flp pilus assembly protein TadD
MFLGGLKEYTKAIKTVDELIRLRPNAHDLYMQKGNFLEIIGDTTSAKLNFEKSLSICNSVLDTMLETNRDYRMLVTHKAINLIMLGDSARANKILKVLYENQSGDSALENIEKEYISSLMHKNRTELMNSFFKPDSTGTGSYPK